MKNVEEIATIKEDILKFYFQLAINLVANPTTALGLLIVRRSEFGPTPKAWPCILIFCDWALNLSDHYSEKNIYIYPSLFYKNQNLSLHTLLFYVIFNIVKYYLFDSIWPLVWNIFFFNFMTIA